MIILTDTFNSKVLSRHRTVRAAVEARIKHARSLKHHQGDTSYVTYAITSTDDRDVSHEVDQAESDIYHSRP